MYVNVGTASAVQCVVWNSTISCEWIYIYHHNSFLSHYPCFFNSLSLSRLHVSHRFFPEQSVLSLSQCKLQLGNSSVAMEITQFQPVHLLQLSWTYQVSIAMPPASPFCTFAIFCLCNEATNHCIWNVTCSSCGRPNELVIIIWSKFCNKLDLVLLANRAHKQGT